MIGLSLAEDSKSLAVVAGHDSFSMQTLAILTMAFLPATFLATVFAMPIMEWEKGMGAVMRPEIALYIGLSVPLTVCIFGGWIYLIRQRKRTDDEKKRESRKAVEELAWPKRLPSRPSSAATA